MGAASLLLIIAALVICWDAYKRQIPSHWFPFLFLGTLLFPIATIPVYLFLRFKSNATATPPKELSDFCPKCGEPVSKSSDICPHCQNRLHLN